MQEDSRTDIGRFLGRIGNKVVWNSYILKKRRMDNVAEIMMINFCESGHPVFRGSSASERGDLKSKEKGKSSTHLNGSHEKHRVASSHNHFGQSVQFLRSSTGYV